MKPTDAPHHPLLDNLHLACVRRADDLRSHSERLRFAREGLQTALIQRLPFPAVLEHAPVLRAVLQDFESLSPLPPEPGGRVFAAEFYRLLDPGCQADRAEVADGDYSPAVVAMLNACQTLTILCAQLRQVAANDVSDLRDPWHDSLRQQFRLE